MRAGGTITAHFPGKGIAVPNKLPRQVGIDPSVPEALQEMFVRSPYAAVITGVNLSTIQRHLRTGSLKGEKLGRDWLVNREALRWWQPDKPGPKPEMD